MALPIRVAVAGTALALCVALPTQAQAVAGGHGQGAPSDALTTKTPYAPQGTPASYQKAPKGFTPVFAENVSRHGSRTLSDSSDGDALEAVWQQARAAGELTRRGQRLGPDIETILDANAADGYGLLTSVGVDEMRSTARRMVQRLPQLFDGQHGGVDVVAASQQRTVDSADEYVAGLESAAPAITAHVGATRTDDDLLYFHKAAANADYTAYTKSAAVKDAEAEATDQPRTYRLATAALERSFSRSFVESLSDDDKLADAEALYALDQSVADLGRETRVDFSPYLSARQAAWFGYLDDVTSFYENGPGFAGSDITYKMAGVLLDDMFAQLDAKRAGTSSLAAELRFTHAEEIFPLEALLGLKGASEQLPAGTLFTYADSPFRGARVAPMGANVQWDLFRKGSTYLVRMLVDEKQTAFKASCTPIAKGSYFYDLDELESCYGYDG